MVNFVSLISLITIVYGFTGRWQSDNVLEGGTLVHLEYLGKHNELRVFYVGPVSDLLVTNGTEFKLVSKGCQTDTFMATFAQSNGTITLIGKLTIDGELFLQTFVTRSNGLNDYWYDVLDRVIIPK